MNTGRRALAAGATAGILLFAIESVLAAASGGSALTSPLIHWIIYALIGAGVGLCVRAALLLFGQPADWLSLSAGTGALLVIPSIFERAYRLSEIAGTDWLFSAILAVGIYLFFLAVLSAIVRPAPIALAWLTVALSTLVLIEVHRSVLTQASSPSALAWDGSVALVALAIGFITRWRPALGLASWVVASVLALLFLSNSFSSPSRESLQRPHLVMVLVDTLRQDVFAAVIEETVEGKAFQEAIAGSVWFTQAIAAAPWTAPSVGSILTGLYPQEHGMEKDPDSPQVFGVTQLDVKTKTLASQLAENGYKTAALVTNGYLHPRSGIARGFSEYHILRGANAIHPMLEIPERLGWLPTNAYQQAIHVRRRLDSRLSGWLATDQPVFLWLHLMDPHLPTYPHPELPTDPDGENLPADRREYRNEVRSALVEVTEMVNLLREAGVWEDTVFVFSSDHGELLASDQHPMPRIGGGIRLYGHGHALYDPLVRIPLVIRPNGKRAQDTIFDGVVSQVDYVNTFLGLVGVSEGPSSADAVNWSSLLRDDDLHTIDRFAQSERIVLSGSLNQGGPLRAATGNGWRYIESPTGEAEVELFDLESDPREQENLAPTQPEKAKIAQKNLVERWSQLGQSKTTGVDLDDATMRQLEALGYAE